MAARGAIAGSHVALFVVKRSKAWVKLEEDGAVIRGELWVCGYIHAIRMVCVKTDNSNLVQAAYAFTESQLFWHEFLQMVVILAHQ